MYISTTHSAAGMTGASLDVLRSESDHRIANNLALIIGLLRLRSRALIQKPGPIARDEVCILLEDIATRVDTVARLHRILSRPSRHESVDVADFLQEICGSLAASLGGRRVVLSQDAEFCLLPPDHALALGLLVVELMTNAVKYAHPAGLEVKIRVICRQTRDGKLIVDFSDDGVGLPENFDPKVDGGLGFRLVRSLGHQLGAAISFDSDELGTRIRVEMPVGVMAEVAE